jgi:hypothetical protein
VQAGAAANFVVPFDTVMRLLLARVRDISPIRHTRAAASTLPPSTSSHWHCCFVSQNNIVALSFIFPAGLVRVLTAACPELEAAIEQQQQQPADTESLLCTRLLAAAVLHVLRRCILADRPAQV